MRRAMIFAVLALSLLPLDIRRSKAKLRRLLTTLCRMILNWRSQPYHMRECCTIVFAPHQDDETLGCGALIARKRHEGLPVHVVFITDGSASHPRHPRYSPGEIASIRRSEARRSLDQLGVESGAVHFMNAPDGLLDHLPANQREELIGRIVGLLATVQPDKIFLPYGRDGSTEHDAAFTLVCAAIRKHRRDCEIWQYPVWAWWNPYSLVRLAFSGRGCCKHATEDFGAAKAGAIRCYASQVQPLAPWLTPTLPPELVHVFHAESEYFFRYELPPAAE